MGKMRETQKVWVGGNSSASVSLAIGFSPKTQSKNLLWREITAVCSAMRYIVDPPKSPLKRGTLIYCTLLQRFALYL